MSSDAIEAHVAQQPIDATDLGLLVQLREIQSRIDPPPAGLADRVKFELTLAALHAEIAELEHLSLAGVRGEQAVETPGAMTFTASTRSVMITVTPIGSPVSATQVRIDGWVTGGPARVELIGAIETRSTTADDTGRFVLDEVSRGSVRLAIHPLADAARPIVTPAFEV